jgi:hypothetical protein
MKSLKIKMLKINGSLYTKNKLSTLRLKSIGIKNTWGFLSLDLLKNHVEKCGFILEVESI